MMSKNTIQNKKKLSTLEANLEQLIKREEAQLEHKHKSYAQGKPPGRRKSFFSETWVGRFLSDHTRTGRAARRIGLAALGFGGLSVAGIGPELNPFTDRLYHFIDQLNELVLVLGALLTTLSHLMDKLEQYQRITREQEYETGKIPAIKKVLRASPKPKKNKNKRDCHEKFGKK